MIDREILATRLSKLREALRKLKKISEKSRKAFLSSETDKALSEHYLRIALEATLDVGNHLIAAKGLRKPLKMADIPTILGEHKIIPKALAKKLSAASGLRNRLVHNYAEIDHGLLYDVLQQDRGDLEQFAQIVAKLCR